MYIYIYIVYIYIYILGVCVYIYIYTYHKCKENQTFTFPLVFLLRSNFNSRASNSRALLSFFIHFSTSLGQIWTKEEEMNPYPSPDLSKHFPDLNLEKSVGKIRNEKVRKLEKVQDY